MYPTFSAIIVAIKGPPSPMHNTTQNATIAKSARLRQIGENEKEFHALSA
jgi:hypothetical protein